VNRLVVEDVLALVEMLNELGDTAAEVELRSASRFFPFIRQLDRQTLVQERKLAEPGGQRIEVELRRGHDGAVWLESDLGARALAGFACLGQRSLGNTRGVVLFPSETVAPDLQVQRFGERVYATHANPMQAAGDFITVGIELAASVELRHYDFSRRYAFFGV